MIINICENCDAGFTFEENYKQVTSKSLLLIEKLVRADITSLLGKFVPRSFVIDLARYLDLHLQMRGSTERTFAQ
jgi:hypothetical protein